MSERERYASRSLWQSRVAARAPRAIAFAALGFLCIAGLRAVLAPGSETATSAPSFATPDLAAESFAEAFARAYLTWDSIDRHARRIAAFLSDDLDEGAGLTPPTRRQQVLWTSVVEDRSEANGGRLVTVVADTTGGTYDLAVPLERDARGFLFVARYPALVGALPAATHAVASEEPEVEDGGLRAVARRAVANYLERQGANLKADLDATAVAALPSQALAVSEVESITWAGPRRVAVQVSAEGAGARWTLRYELDVVKRERWYVRSIETNPTERRPL
jgi:hypothetical protein